MSGDVAFLTIAELGKAYRSGDASPVAVTREMLARIERHEPALNAFIRVLKDEAIAEAETAERELRAGRDRGPLHGVPIAIKDMIAIAGLPTTFASRAASPRVPNVDAKLVRNLKNAGAVNVGKTNLLEYAYGAVHPDFGQTNNPWDAKRTSGGSSSGSGAAVSAGLAYGAVGTDTGGSARIPAAYCGIVGLKPTYGLVSVDGVEALSTSLDHACPLARNCADTAIMLSGMLGEPFPMPTRALSGLRIGLLQHPGAERWVEPGVQRLFDNAVEILKRHGATVRALDIEGLKDVTNAVIKIIEPEASFIHRAMIRHDAKGLSANTRAQFEAGFGVSAIEYVEALHVQRQLQATFLRLFDNLDAMLSPAVAWIAPAEDPQMGDERGTAEMLFSGVHNLLGLPAVSIPCGLSEGLPVGLQIATTWGADALALAIGAALEPHLPVLGRPPVS